MRRLTVDEVAAALASPPLAGWTLARTVTVDAERRRCCPIGAVALANGLDPEAASLGACRRHLGLSEDYQARFLGAFDGRSIWPLPPGHPAVEDARAIAAALLPEP